MDVKGELEKRAGKQSTAKLKKGMSFQDMIHALEPEIKKALPAVITPERFTRMALSAFNTTPRLAECSQLSVLAALMNAAQLGLEPNTPLGQAYLIPYNNRGKLECQFQIGYKGLLDLAYRNDQLQMISAQIVYENDEFEYEQGLEPKLLHRPALHDRGEMVLFYAFFRLRNGGYGIEVMAKEDMDIYAKKYSKSFASDFSPWKSDYESMAKKTMIKKVLKFAPIRTDLQKAVSMDESIKTQLSADMSEVKNEDIVVDICEETNY